MLMLAVVALLVSAYLTFTSLATSIAPASCGAESGCAQVLATKWSRWWKLPVTGLAVVAYLVVLFALVLSVAQTHARRRTGWVLLLAAATTVSGAAAWFVYIQANVIHAFCTYCMVAHGSGLALAGLVFWHRPWRGRDGAAAKLSGNMTCGAIICGILGVLTLMIVQFNTDDVIGRLKDVATDGDFDRDEAGRRHVGLLGGRLNLVVDQEPTIGPLDGEQLLAVMLDYACPHCRRMHELLLELNTEGYRGGLTVIALPVPLNRKCNPHAPEQMHRRFDHSCELARIVLAVFLADRSKFAAMDDWMYRSELPRDPAEARTKAERLVGEAALEQALTDPRVKTMLDRNVEAYADSGADRLPVIFIPGADPIVGRVDDIETLKAILSGIDE